jgi:two-component system response regulator AtoC
VSKAGLILFVDDDPNTRKVARANLPLDGFEVLVASSGAEALSRLDEADPLAMVTDLQMPDLDGIALMEQVHARRPSLPVVLVTAHATVETAVAAMRKGALHYLTKPVRWDELALVLRHAVAHERARRDVERLRGELERATGFEELVGDSPAMRDVFRVVDQVAGADATVLLRGETGTGKELVARAVHRRSPRRDRPFVAVNCTAVPRELMESEFFGHERGAFTGAVVRRVGRFEQADGGTLFLDEVGDLDLAIQAKLLRVLQEREITRVGGQRAEKLDVRIVAATNRDLEALVKEGKFRDDLYYRLNVIPVRLPALRERPGDLAALLEHFLHSFAERFGRSVPPPPPAVLAAALAYPWPGNVRELRNLCERAALMGWEAVAPLLGQATPAGPAVAGSAEFGLPLLDARARLVERFEREYLTRLLREHKGKVGEVARAAGIAERNLYEKLKAYGLSRDDYR